MIGQPPGQPPPGAPPYPPPPPAGPAYPPAPPGTAAAPPAYAPDPYAAQREAEQWATSQGYSYSAAGDPAWYQGWAPFVYLFRFARVGREIRAQFQDTGVFIVEAFDPNPLLQASGDDCAICGFVTSSRLVARAAVRAKVGGGVMNELKSGFGALFAQPGTAGVLADPTFEARFDVSAPSRDEGNRALPMALRQQLLASGWRGILEIRPGGLVCTTFGQRAFDKPTLEAAHGTLSQMLGLLAS